MINHRTFDCTDVVPVKMANFELIDGAGRSWTRVSTDFLQLVGEIESNSWFRNFVTNQSESPREFFVLR